MMPRFALLAAVFLSIAALAQPGFAQDQRMITEAEQPLWAAVGRLNIAGNRYCTGTLIAPDQVITAAHCLYHPVTRHVAHAADIRFVAGFRRDSYAALVRVSAVVILPGYTYVGYEADIPSIPYDLALIRLERAILPSEATPLAVTDWPTGEVNVDIVGYGRDRPLIASIRTACPYLDAVYSVKLMDCVIVPGLSGAPAVLAGSQDLVAVVTTSVGTRVKGEQSLIVPIAPQLAALRALLEE